VVGYGLTRKSEAIVALKRLESAGAKVAGVVLNRIPRSNKGYYKLYHYDYGMAADASRSIRLGKLTIPLGTRRSQAEKAKAADGETATVEQAATAADDTL
jgi:hypothetical protein